MIARCLQERLAIPWLVMGVDDLIEAMPQHGIADGSLLRFGDSGQVETGPNWQSLEASWYIGIAAIAASGTGVIVDEVFLGAAESQETLRTFFTGLEVVWVGVLCDAQMVAARETLRPERITSMAESQALIVHTGVDFDITVDTSESTPEECAATIISSLSGVE